MAPHRRRRHVTPVGDFGNERLEGRHVLQWVRNPFSLRAARLRSAISFVRSAAEIGDGIAELERRVFPDGAIWFAWPRRAAGHNSDVTEDAIRAAVLPEGLVDVKVCAIDEDWSGLKVVWRRSERGRPPK